MDQECQWIQTLRTPTILESEELRPDGEAIDGRILSSLSWNGRRRAIRESFGAELSAAWMTAMISGPMYGSTSEPQRAADITRSRARRQYTSPVGLFLEKEMRMCKRPKEGSAKFRRACFRRGNTSPSAVLYRAKSGKRAWGVLRERWQVAQRFWRCGLGHRSQARGSAAIRSTKSVFSMCPTCA